MSHAHSDPIQNQYRLQTFLAIVLGTTAAACAQPDPSGIDFLTVGAINNPAYAGRDVNNAVTGRGSVAYEYKIGRTEVTTAQWMEFYNAFYGRVNNLSLPFNWGAVSTGNPNEPFRLNPNVPDAGLLPVSGITWRTCAKFCNWLCNDKRTDLSAIADGAYDISTFNSTNGIFNDQPATVPMRSIGFQPWMSGSRPRTTTPTTAGRMWVVGGI